MPGPSYHGRTHAPGGTDPIPGLSSSIGTPGPAGPVFGDGSDGSVSLTRSSSAPAWASKSGSGASTVFQLSRDLYAIDCTFGGADGSFLVETNGYRIFAIGALTIDLNVTVGWNGKAGSLGAIAGAGLSNGTIGGSGSGGLGSVGGNGTNPGDITGSIATEATVATSIGGQGGNESGGPGTGGGNATGGKASCVAQAGSPHNLLQATQLMLQGSQTRFIGGAGGGGGDGSGSATGGAGGSGGGIVAIYAHRIVNDGTISAEGGTGGGAALLGGPGAGGGGGGSGGAIILVYVNDGISNVGAVSVAGGIGGPGEGAGCDGAQGQTGLIWEFPL